MTIQRYAVPKCVWKYLWLTLQRRKKCCWTSCAQTNNESLRTCYNWHCANVSNVSTRGGTSMECVFLRLPETSEAPQGVIKAVFMTWHSLAGVLRSTWQNFNIPVTSMSQQLLTESHLWSNVVHSVTFHIHKSSKLLSTMSKSEICQCQQHTQSSQFHLPRGSHEAEVTVLAVCVKSAVFTVIYIVYYLENCFIAHHCKSQLQ